MNGKGPFDGIRVVDLATALAAPGAAAILADQGADVIKIEPPGIGDIMRYLGVSRNGVSPTCSSTTTAANARSR